MLIAVDPARAQLFHQESDIHLATLPDPYSIFLRWELCIITAHTNHTVQPQEASQYRMAAT